MQVVRCSIHLWSTKSCVVPVLPSQNPVVRLHRSYTDPGSRNRVSMSPSSNGLGLLTFNQDDTSSTLVGGTKLALLNGRALVLHASCVGSIPTVSTKYTRGGSAAGDPGSRTCRITAIQGFRKALIRVQFSACPPNYAVRVGLIPFRVRYRG
jgi:hypothetical protein